VVQLMVDLQLSKIKFLASFLYLSFLIDEKLVESAKPSELLIRSSVNSVSGATREKVRSSSI